MEGMALVSTHRKAIERGFLATRGRAVLARLCPPPTPTSAQVDKQSLVEGATFFVACIETNRRHFEFLKC